ncbi:ANTAR domain-containing protein [Nocardioides antri]|uniref:ANTAR domain-containing protein n=1 Tax=Nocardioides antri TaxID=2607659 RepID=A0A5B1M6N1_9ACTN|nr:ANTAR domain-containing protein [Nocardioides antri]KAA1428652.1 ANTAR domain-containing protein [Nocardioides antri]
MSESNTDTEDSQLRMEPIPPTRDAVGQLDPIGEDDMLGTFLARAARVRQLVPACIGLSITLLDEDLTFTLVATDHTVAVLNAVQYLDGGPCANIVDDQAARQYTLDELAERRWQLFADASAAAGVASTLTLPMLDMRGRVTSSVNLYGAAPHCFDGQHVALAEIFAAWAPGAVTNADLSFHTRHRAANAPEKLRAQHRVNIAAGMIAERDAISIDEATRTLHESARRAGVDLSDLAEAVVLAHQRRQA